MSITFQSSPQDIQTIIFRSLDLKSRLILGRTSKKNKAFLETDDAFKNDNLILRTLKRTLEAAKILPDQTEQSSALIPVVKALARFDPKTAWLLSKQVAVDPKHKALRAVLIPFGRAYPEEINLVIRDFKSLACKIKAFVDKSILLNSWKDMEEAMEKAFDIQNYQTEIHVRQYITQSLVRSSFTDRIEHAEKQASYMFEKAKPFATIAQSVALTNPEKARNLLNGALIKADQINDSYEKSQVLLDILELFISLDSQKAKNLLGDVHNLLPEIEDEEKKEQVILGLAKVSALLKIPFQLPDNDLLKVKTLVVMSVHNKEKSEEYIKQALTFVENLKEPKDKAWAYLSIARVYSPFDMLEKASDAASLIEEASDKEAVLIEIAKILVLHNPEKALALVKGKLVAEAKIAFQYLKKSNP